MFGKNKKENEDITETEKKNKKKPQSSTTKKGKGTSKEEKKNKKKQKQLEAKKEQDAKRDKETLKERFKQSRTLYKDYEIIIIMLSIFFAHFGLFYFLTTNMVYSIIVSIVGMLFFFFVYAYPNKKLSRYQEDLQGLLEYVMNMSFFLSNGQNVLSALKSAHTMASPRIRKDIEVIIHSLEDTTELYTDNFKKYKYPSLNQFHANLMIYYQKGGDAHSMFQHIQNSMAFELRKRDELHRKRKGLALNVYVLLGIVTLIAVVLRGMVNELWDMFINFPVMGLGTLTITFFAILLNLRALQKHNLDISIKH